jgi:protein-tyrosine kinase
MKITKAMQRVKDQQMPARAKRAQPKYHQVQRAGGAEGNWVPPVYWYSQSCEPDLFSMEKNRCVCFKEDTPELDYYKMLRTQIMQRTQAKGWNTVMITSALPGEGKTVTSINLAMTFAKAYNQTALLVDSDLRQQKVYCYLGIDSRLGIFDHLVEGRPLQDIIIWPRIEKMTLISGGRIINESAELLGSPKMKFLVEEMKTRYNDRYILFDAPPVLSGADALILSSLVDGIVMVVEADKTPLKDIQEALTLMPKEKFLGFVLNKHTSRRKGYYYYNYRSAKGRSKRR